VDEQILGPQTPPPPLCLPLQDQIKAAAALIKTAQRPLVIVGKGAAYAGAERQVAQLVTYANLPFLATPMGKGVIDDADPKSVAPARCFIILNLNT